MRAFPLYHAKGILPNAGGSLDQDDELMAGLNLVSLLIDWWKVEEKKTDYSSARSIDEA